MSLAAGLAFVNPEFPLTPNRLYPSETKDELEADELGTTYISLAATLGAVLPATRLLPMDKAALL